MPEFSDVTRSRLAALLPAAASVANPVDMIASATPQQYAQVIETVLVSGEIDALIVIYIPVGLSETEAVISAIRAGTAAARAAGANDIPVLACMMAEQGRRPSSICSEEKIPTYTFPEAAARVLGKIAAYAEWRTQPEGMIPDFDDVDLTTAREVCRKSLAEHGPGWLSAEDTRAVLAAVRLPLAARAVLPGRQMKPSS